MEKIILDTDIGTDIDDAVCLAYLLRQPACELLGVTTVTGQADKRASLVDALCRAEGREDIPIHVGTMLPCIVPQRQTEAGQAAALEKYPHRSDWEIGTAVAFLREMIHSHPGEITLLTIGPLTNIGLLFALDREVPRLLKSLVMMVGDFRKGGGAGGLEWNAICDPHATAIVFGADVPRAVCVGLNVTRQCIMPKTELQAKLQGPMLEIVREMAQFWGRDQITFHDPLAATLIFDPAICGYETGQIVSELHDVEQLARTDFEVDPAGRFEVAVDVDSRRFFDHYFGTVRR